MKQIRYFLVYDNVLTQVSQGRNTAFGARQGEGKSEGNVHIQKARWAYSLRTSDSPHISAEVQQV